LKFYGSAHIRFSKGLIERDTYVVNETILKEKSYYFGSRDSEAIELPVGVRKFKFAYQLPLTLPHSVKGDKGYIRYGVQVLLKRPFFSSDWEYGEFFHVGSCLDVKLQPELNCSVNFEGRSSNGDKPLIMKVQLQKTGFILGENIPVHVELINKSSSVISFTCFEIKLIEHYSSPTYHQSKLHQENVGFATAKGVDMRSEDSFDTLVAISKDLQVSNVTKTLISMNITYELWISAGGAKVKIPIVIGPVCC
jgi:hypothetical protein